MGAGREEGAELWGLGMVWCPLPHPHFGFAAGAVLCIPQAPSCTPQSTVLAPTTTLTASSLPPHHFGLSLPPGEPLFAHPAPLTVPKARLCHHNLLPALGHSRQPSRCPQPAVLIATGGPKPLLCQGSFYLVRYRGGERKSPGLCLELGFSSPRG